MTQRAESPCCIGISIGTPDRGKVTLHWYLSEERARDFIAELTECIGEADHEFITAAEAIDFVARELFKPGGGVLQIEHDA